MQQSLERQGFASFEWLVEIGFTNKSDLNAALNRLVRRSKGELLVFYQDNIEIPPDALQKFWEAHKEQPAFYTAAVSDDWRNQKENWNVTREFTDWEIDWGSCPREAIIKIGGFDEALDEWWGFDNVNAGLRAVMAGYKILCINNPAKRIPHEDAPMKKMRNPVFHNYRLDQIRQGEKVNFLQGA